MQPRGLVLGSFALVFGGFLTAIVLFVLAAILGLRPLRGSDSGGGMGDGGD